VNSFSNILREFSLIFGEEDAGHGAG